MFLAMEDSDLITLLLCGDVMTGRGIDQILPHAGDPVLFEPYMTSAEGYVALAEGVNGPLPRPVEFAYIWGDTLHELRRTAPDVRIVNLETSITARGDHWRGKGINYRMHPGNVPCLTTAGIDCCSLANNHVLDWGYDGLIDTLEALDKAGIKRAGAGRDRQEAERPAIIDVGPRGRVLVFSCGVESSGIPPQWAAGPDRPGINLLRDLSRAAIQRIAAGVRHVKRRRDVVVLSVHWGPNWGYHVPQEQIAFAHCAVDAGIDVVHGHSSHHVKGIEVYGGKPILYGCGDLLNDYEGIGGYEQFRADLPLMYFLHMEPAAGNLAALHLRPFHIRRLRLNRASRLDASWLNEVLNREGARFGTRFELQRNNVLRLLYRYV